MLNSTASCMGLLILAVKKRRYLERASIVIRESASVKKISYHGVILPRLSRLLHLGGHSGEALVHSCWIIFEL